MKTKLSKMGAFTAVFCVILAGLMVASCVYLITGPDFVPPEEVSSGGTNADSPIWDCTMEDLVDYLDEKGFVDKDDYFLMSEIGTENRIYNGIDIIWWDVDNLVEGTYPYDTWQEINENGYILFAGTVYCPIINGPFGISANIDFPGDVNELQKAFQEFTGEKP